MGSMKMKFIDKLYFYLDYFLAKIVFVWWEVQTPAFRVFLCEAIYSFGKVFHHYTDFTSSLYRIDYYQTRFGKYHIRKNTMDVISASPAFERPDILYLQKLFKREMEVQRHITFVDVGADFGSYTIMAANFFKDANYRNINIYSFEPTQSSYRTLERNVKANDLGGLPVRIFNYGLSFENNSAIPILFNEEDPGSTSIKNIKRDIRIAHRQRSETISVKTLDTVSSEGDLRIIPGALFIKIDVEGYETHVLEGALKTIRDERYSDVYVMVEDSIDGTVNDFLKAQSFYCLGKFTPYNSWWQYRPPVSSPAIVTTLLSVIIVNWNGKKWLEKCLDSLESQTCQDYEVVLVDNDSSDGSVEFVRTRYPKVRVVESGGNLGFSGGNNLGVKHAKGKYVVLLNNDTWVEPNYLEVMVKAFDEIPRLGAAQSKIVLMSDPEKLDACGAYWSHSSFLYHYGYFKNQREKKYNMNRPLFSNKGASMIIRRDLIEKIGLFDEDFWCYYEETDFCHRVWLAGYECWYYPQTTVHHAIGGTSTFFQGSHIQFHNLKNKLRSYIKNLEIGTLCIVLPFFVFLNIGLGFLFVFRGRPGQVQAFVRAVIWNIHHIGETLQERKRIQRWRVKKDADIFSIVRKEPEASYYYHLIVDLGKYEDKI